MSISNFQRALSKLVMSPPFRSAVQVAPRQALAEFDLSSRDYRRLVMIANERGLEISTMIHRSFRLSMLANALPRTCTLLGPDKLKEIVHAYWRSEPSRDYYYEREALRFADYVFSKLERGEIHNEFLQDILRLELAMLSLARDSVSEALQTRTQILLCDPDVSCPLLNPLYRIVIFRHDPEILLTALAKGQVPPGVPRGTHYLLIARSSSGEVQIEPINAWLGGLLSTCDGQSSVAHLCTQFSLTIEEFEKLAQFGYLVI